MSNKRLDNVKLGLETAFLNKDVMSNLAYKPQFVSNNHKEGTKVLSSIEEELLRCSEFFISVAFITQGGITPLLQTLEQLEKRGVSGKILTTDYLTFSEPRAFECINKLSNIELKMYCTDGKEEGFHTKGYIFREKELYRIIVGSSNLTNKALTENKEWNTKIISTDQGEYADSILKEFNQLWNSNKTKNYDEFIDEYSLKYKLIKEQRKLAKKVEVPSVFQYKLEPNKMQVEFVDNLMQLVKDGEKRGLLISATGDRVIIMTGRKSPVKSRAWAA